MENPLTKDQMIYLLLLTKIDEPQLCRYIIGLKNKKEKIEITNKELENERNRLIHIRKFIENNFEYVGNNFSKKVREIYYDKKSKKAIYGTATPEEREELADEGVDLLSVPWIDKDN